MIVGLVPLEVHRELFMPAWAFGAIALAILLIALIAVHGVSTRRPHS